MTSIPITDILTIIFVLVDDWYQAEGHKFLQGKVGRKPEFRDSEVITLMLAQDFIPFPSETQYIGYLRANYLALFPKLLDQSQFNRRARGLRLLLEQFRRYWIVRKGWHRDNRFLLDTKPIPVLGYKRGKNHSDFAGSADYGHCASRNLDYFGYKWSMTWFLPTRTNEKRLKPSSIISPAAISLRTKGFWDWNGRRRSLTRPTT